MGLFDGLFGGGSSDNLVAGDGTQYPNQFLLPGTDTPIGTPGDGSTFLGSPNIGGGGGGLLSALGGLSGMNLGGAPGQVKPPMAQAAPANQPQGSGGHADISIPSPLNPAPGPIVPGTGQPSAYMGPQAPLGAGAQDPILMMLLKQRLGMAG